MLSDHGLLLVLRYNVRSCLLGDGHVFVGLEVKGILHNLAAGSREEGRRLVNGLFIGFVVVEHFGRVRKLNGACSAVHFNFN